MLYHRQLYVQFLEDVSTLIQEASYVLTGEEVASFYTMSGSVLTKSLRTHLILHLVSRSLGTLGH